MDWRGKWRNQYGSTLQISSQDDNRIFGQFETALRDSAFFGSKYDVFGVHCGDCVSFTFAGRTAKGDTICTFTGLWRDGKIEAVWHLVSDSLEEGKRPWPHAVMTNADTFEVANQ